MYQRSKLEPDTLPFGTRLDVNPVGYEWVNHSLAPTHLDPASLRITVGSPQCTQPYSARLEAARADSFASQIG